MRCKVARIASSFWDPGSGRFALLEKAAILKVSSSIATLAIFNDSSVVVVVDWKRTVPLCLMLCGLMAVLKKSM